MIYLKTCVGIELRGEDMLISALQSNFSGSVFTHFTRIANYRLCEKADLRDQVNYFFKSNMLGKDNVVLGISRQDIVLRTLEFPSEVADNLKQVVRYQVQSFEPTDDDRLYHDFVPLNESASTKKLTVLLVTVRKALLDEHLRLLRDIGIRPAAVMGSSMGLANLFLQSQKNPNSRIFILADLSASAVELLALRNGALTYSQQAVKQDNQDWRDLIAREMSEAAAKMRLDPEATLEKIVLAGESSAAAFEEMKADFPDCELMRKSIRITVPRENAAHVQEAASTLGLAFTGTLRRPPIRINLLPTEMRVRQTRWAYVPAAILGLAIVALLIALGFHGMVQNRMLVRELDKAIASNKPAVARVQSLRAQSEAMEAKIKAFEELLRKRDMNLEILQELTNILPMDTYLLSYNNRDGTILMVGFSGSYSDLIPKLEQSPLLKDVVPKGTIYKDAQTGKDRFTIEAKLER